MTSPGAPRHNDVGRHANWAGNVTFAAPVGRATPQGCDIVGDGVRIAAGITLADLVDAYLRA